MTGLDYQSFLLSDCFDIWMGMGAVAETFFIGLFSPLLVENNPLGAWCE